MVGYIDNNYFDPARDETLILHESLRKAVNDFLVQEYERAVQHQDFVNKEFLESFAINGGGFNIYKNIFRITDSANGNFIAINLLGESTDSSTMAKKNKTINFEVLVFYQSQKTAGSLIQQENSSVSCYTMLKFVERALDYQTNLYLKQKIGLVANSTKVQSLKLVNDLDVMGSTVYNVASLDLDVKYNYEKSALSGFCIGEVYAEMSTFLVSKDKRVFIDIAQKKDPALNTENRFYVDFDDYEGDQQFALNLSYIVDNTMYFNEPLYVYKDAFMFLGGDTPDVEYFVISAIPLNGKTISCRITYSVAKKEIIFFVEAVGNFYINTLQMGAYVGGAC